MRTFISSLLCLAACIEPAGDSADAVCTGKCDSTATSSLPRFVRLDVRLSEGTDIFGRSEFHGMFRLVAPTTVATGSGTLTLGVENSIDNAQLDIAIAQGMTLADLDAAVVSALATRGLETAIAYEGIEYARTNQLVAVFRPGTGAPAPRRDPAELGVVFRSVELVEQSGSTPPLIEREPSDGQGPHVNAFFRDHLAADLKNFIQYGASSLTPYEASLLQFGMSISGHSRSEQSRRFRSGDRVEVSIGNWVTRGIVLQTSAVEAGDASTVLINDHGRFAAISIVTALDGAATGSNQITRVISRGLIDGR
jgi:hypothetical protein